MNQYLFSISIGPVQEFIAAARRTADLTAGSTLLQQLAMHIAKQISAQGGQLIFPATDCTPGPNKVVATVQTDDPAQLADDLRHSAVQWLKDSWQSESQRLNVTVDSALVDEQFEQFLEFYAAWVPYRPTDYAACRERVELLLAGRKALRDFVQIPPRPGRWKSPLDPSRDGVLELQDGRVPLPAQDDPLYLKPREYLDAISLLKRLLGSKGSGAPSTSEMAARSLPIITREPKPEAVRRLEEIANNAPGRLDIGDLMFPTRVQEEARSGNARMSLYLKQHEHDITGLRRQVLKEHGRHECPPYYVLLTADGDQMGKRIRQMTSIEQHQQFSQSLADFATQARNIVQRHHGYPIYAGGDDLLAMLPVNTAIACAVQLADKFRDGVQATLSIGIAIVHHLENLYQALEWARQAEGEAKQLRNALAVALHTRGGVPLTVVTSFQDDPYQEAWTRWERHFREGLTHGFPYELQRLAREWQNSGLSVDSLRAEALRIYDRKEGREARGQTPDARKHLEQELERTHNPNDLLDLANRLVIARFLATVPQAEVNA